MTRPFYWSVQREVWENRSVLVVPAVAALLYLVAFALNLPGWAAKAAEMATLDPAQQSEWLAHPYRMTCFLLTLAALLTGLFYSLDALHGERRDRSILFWKSLPVSDRVTVLSKAFIPLILLPVLALAFSTAAILVMLLLSAVVLLAGGVPMGLLGHAPVLSIWLEMLGGTVMLAVWQAPMHAWLLLVSGWARRAVLLWAALLPLAICLFERFAFGTDRLASMLLNRLTAGVLGEGLFGGHFLNVPIMDRLVMLSPGTMAADPNLWFGLVPTVLLLAGAIAARRYRQPL